MAGAGVPSPDQPAPMNSSSTGEGSPAQGSRWGFLRRFRRSNDRPPTTPETVPNEAATKASDSFLDRLNVQGIKRGLEIVGKGAGPALLAEYFLTPVLGQVLSGEQYIALVLATGAIGAANTVVGLKNA